MASPESEHGYWAEVESVFADALAAGDTARVALIEARCGTRPGLRVDVETLLAAHARAGEFMAAPTLAGIADPVGDVRDDVPPGLRVGAFRLVERVAHGGMGDVYRAERAEGEFTQHVAVKFIAARLQGADTVRRFRAERQILASLQHPNIVTLVDGGVTVDGQPYIVMEYVDGLPLTEYCLRQATTLDGRLRLFQQVCGAVSFAHRHLIVHRDLKPANVLVTADGVVKVLDFGVAKLLTSQDVPSPATVSLLRPLTPNYASPEQIRGLPVTTSADVYALGVMLYELIAGRRPYETAGRTLDEIVTIVLNQSAARPSAARGVGLPYDPKRLRGDVDAIVLKAIAKDAGMRYGSVEEMSDDVGRFLAARPVVACPPSLAYVARKAIVRHRAAFAVAAVLFVLLLAATIGALWQARVAAGERERAVRRYNDVRQLAGSLIFRIHDEVEALAGSTPVRAIIIGEALKFLQRLEQDAASDTGLRLELAQAYVRIGNVQGRRSAANLGDRKGALQSYRKAKDMIAPIVSTDAASWEKAKTIVDVQLALAYALTGDDPAGALSAAKAALDAALAWQRREPSALQGGELLARAHFAVAVASPGHASLPHWQESNRLFAEVLARDPGNENRQRNVALTEKYLGAYFEEERDADRMLEHHQRAYAIDQKRADAAVNNRQAQIDLAIDLGNIALAKQFRGAYADAIGDMRKSLEIRERLSAGDPKDAYARGRVGHAQYRMATLYLSDGQLGPAAEHARRAIAIIESLGTTDLSSDLGAALHVLAIVEWKTLGAAASCATYSKAAAAFARDPNPDLPRTFREVKADVDRATKACRERQ